MLSLPGAWNRPFMALLQITRLYSTMPLSCTTWQDLKEALGHRISSHCCSSAGLCRLHAQVISSGLGHNLFIASLLIMKYFQLGDAQTARLVFDARTERPTKPLLWNSMIKGYLHHGLPQLALHVYHEMMRRSIECWPDRNTLHLAITACTQLLDFESGFRVGDYARAKGLESDILVATALITLYFKAGDLKTACSVFEKITHKDVVSWNAMISGFSQAGSLLEVIDLFNQMRFSRVILPTEATLVSLISAHGNFCHLKGGESVHAYVIKTGFEAHLFVLNSLLEMYVVCDQLARAAAFFNWMPVKDAVSWSSMIGGYLRNGQPGASLRLFHWMLLNSKVKPSRPLLLNTILACAELGDWREGHWIEENYISNEDSGFKVDSSLATALIYMYAKCGIIQSSIDLLHRFSEVSRDVVAWNAAIKACEELGHSDRALGFALEMQSTGINPDLVTFLLVLSVISSIPSLKKGIEAHSQIIKRGFVNETRIANSLVSMYAKSGSTGESLKVFNEISEKDVVSWSSMIQAYAWSGNAIKALDCFELMMKTEVTPNSRTFLVVLSACRNAGHVQKGWDLFRCMREKYGLEPEFEHFACMVDLFCRAGCYDDAYRLLKDGESRHRNSTALWGTLLGACRMSGDLAVGEAAAEQLLVLEPRNAGNYKILANAYVSAGRREDANAVLGLLRTRGAEKRPGCSWFEGTTSF